MVRLSVLEWTLAAVAAVLLVVAGVQSWRAHSLSGKVDLLEIAVQGYAAAQATNLGTIKDQTAALADWRARCAVPEGAQDAATAALRAQLAQSRQDLAAAKSNREVIYVRDPAARAWSDAGLPASVADQLFGPADRPH